jgi:hypothetical protein
MTRSRRGWNSSTSTGARGSRLLPLPRGEVLEAVKYPHNFPG